MSIENAILAHAAALSELAAAVRALVDSSMGAVVAGGQRIKGDTAAEAADKTETPEKSIKGTKTKDTGKTESAETATGQVDKAALDKAVADAKAETKTPDTPPADDAGGEPEMDYNKDVKPKLLAAIKRVGKEQVQALIKSFGAEKGDQVPVEKLADLLEKAEAL